MRERACARKHAGMCRRITQSPKHSAGVGVSWLKATSAAASAETVLAGSERDQTKHHDPGTVRNFIQFA